MGQSYNGNTPVKVLNKKVFGLLYGQLKKSPFNSELSLLNLGALWAGFGTSFQPARGTRRRDDYDYDNDNLFVDSVADSDGLFGGNFYFTDWDFCFIYRISTWKTVCYNKITHNT